MEIPVSFRIAFAVWTRWSCGSRRGRPPFRPRARAAASPAGLLPESWSTWYGSPGRPERARKDETVKTKAMNQHRGISVFDFLSTLQSDPRQFSVTAT